jgi:PAS domain-containing protein
MHPRRALRFTIAARLTLLLLATVAASVALTGLLLLLMPSRPLAAAGIAVAIMAPLAVIAALAQLRPMLAILRALGGTVHSYRDGDYAFGLHWPRNDELGDLVEAHNALGGVLREQRLDLVQRELLLDTMVQNTPVAMMLVDVAGKIVFANVSARHLLNEGRRLEGTGLADLLARSFASLREAFERGGDGLFTVSTGDGAEEEIYHLSRRGFILNARRHELLLLRHLTSELRRQEVQTWKKVIRVISHELNNSLAPIASLAKSAAELLRRGTPQRLPEILETVEERARQVADAQPAAGRVARVHRVAAPAGAVSRGRRAARRARAARHPPDAAGAAQPAQERARVGVAPGRGVPLGAPRGRDARDRGRRPRQRHDRDGDGQRPRALLLHQTHGHGPGPRAGARDRRSARRPHRPQQPRGRRAVGHAVRAGEGVALNRRACQRRPRSACGSEPRCGAAASTSWRIGDRP